MSRSCWATGEICVDFEHSNSGELERLEGEQLAERSVAGKLARPGRFERPTLCSGGTRSNPLSYGRAVDCRMLVYRVCACCATAGVSPRSRDSSLALVLNVPRKLLDFFGLFHEAQIHHFAGIGLVDFGLQFRGQFV